MRLDDNDQPGDQPGHDRIRQTTGATLHARSIDRQQWQHTEGGQMLAFGEGQARHEDQGDAGKVQQQARFSRLQQMRAAQNCATEEDDAEAKGEDEGADYKFHRQTEQPRQRDPRQIDQEGCRWIGFDEIDIGPPAVKQALGSREEPTVVAVLVPEHLLRHGERDDERGDTPIHEQTTEEWRVDRLRTPLHSAPRMGLIGDGALASTADVCALSNPRERATI